MNSKKIIDFNFLILGSFYVLAVMVYFYHKTQVDSLVNKFPEIIGLNITQILLPLALIALFFASTLILKKITSISFLILSLITSLIFIYFLINYTLFVDLSCGCAILISLTTLKIISVFLIILFLLISLQLYLRWKNGDNNNLIIS